MSQRMPPVQYIMTGVSGDTCCKCAGSSSLPDASVGVSLKLSCARKFNGLGPPYYVRHPFNRNDSHNQGRDCPCSRLAEILPAQMFTSKEQRSAPVLWAVYNKACHLGEFERRYLERPCCPDKVPSIPLVGVAYVQNHCTRRAAFCCLLAASFSQGRRLNCCAQHLLPL